LIPAILEGVRHDPPHYMILTIACVAGLGLLVFAWISARSIVDSVWLDGDHLLVIARNSRYRIPTQAIAGIDQPYFKPTTSSWMHPSIVRVKLSTRHNGRREFFFVAESEKEVQMLQERCS
jgi:hypothetical protein